MDKELKEIINDLNISIADVDTFSASYRPQNKPITDSLKRAAGQIKAARSSIISASQQMEIGKDAREVPVGPR